MFTQIKMPDDWDLKTKIEHLQRKVILNSIAYYMFDESPLDDFYYDRMCRYLVDLHKEYGDISDTTYGYAFDDFDGSTGYHLFHSLYPEDQEWLYKIAYRHFNDMRPPSQEEIDSVVGYRGDEMKKEQTTPSPDTQNPTLLRDYQLDAVNNMKNGCILCGGVGSGKSRTSLAYYYKEQGGDLTAKTYTPMKQPRDLYIITTARKRDTKEWEGEMPYFLLTTNPEVAYYNNKVVVDSWNNIGKYSDVSGAFFIFDEQRVVGSGAWVKAFLKIAKTNHWILLSATPGDTWMDYIPVFLANGFYRNKTEFSREHIVYSRFSKFPKVDRYINTGRLIRLRNSILVDMDFKRETVAHHEDVYVRYDIPMYKDVMKKRWDPYKDEPIINASGLCYILRRVVNTDESRQLALLELFEKHPKMIVFYNFDYELDILKDLYYGEGVEIAEWNGHKHQPIPDSKRWVYLVQYTAGAEGWNCIKTDTIVFFSQNYSYKIMQQSAGRIDRLNTPFIDLYYYHLKTRSGIDLAISKALKDKKKFNERKFTKWE